MIVNMCNNSSYRQKLMCDYVISKTDTLMHAIICMNAIVAELLLNQYKSKVF